MCDDPIPIMYIRESLATVGSLEVIMTHIGQFRLTPGQLIGQPRVGKGYLMVTVGQQGYLKENLIELHIIVRTTGLIIIINFKRLY